VRRVVIANLVEDLDSVRNRVTLTPAYTTVLAGVVEAVL
jgi:hypothetical protein